MKYLTQSCSVRNFGFLLILSLMINCACHASTTALKFYGLPQQDLHTIGAINAIEQDEQGFMWFAGANGLARFDGYDIKVLQHKDADPYSISTNNITDMVLDHNSGYFWIATYWGLNRYDPRTDEFKHYLHNDKDPNSLSHNAVLKVLLGSKDNLWMATQNGGLNKLNLKNSQFSRYNSNNSPVLNGQINTIYEDKLGMLWVGYLDAGASQFRILNTGELELVAHYNNENGALSHNYVIDIQEDHLGRMWIATQNGLDRLNNDHQWTHYSNDKQAPNSLWSRSVQDLHLDAEERLWIVDSTGRVYQVNHANDDFLRYNPEVEGTSSRIFIDKQGGIWLGISPSGVGRAHRYASAFKNYTNLTPGKDNNKNLEITAVEEDSQGNLWVGTQLSLNYIDRATSEIVYSYLHNSSAPKGRRGSATNGIQLMDDNTLWLGNSWYGLNLLNVKKQEFDHYIPSEDQENDLQTRQIWSITQDSQKQLWIGGHQGWLHKYNADKNNFDAVQINTEYNANRIMVIYEDQNQGLWIGADNGLYHADSLAIDAPFTRYDRNSSGKLIPNNDSIFSILQDSRGRYWFGSNGGGLYHWNPATEMFSTYLTEDGLAGNIVTGILEADNGDIWLSTNKGLSRLDPDLRKFKNFTIQHGLPSNVFPQVANKRLSNGELAFGSGAGLTVFDPDDIYQNTHAPSVVITEFLLFNRPITPFEDNDMGRPPLLTQQINYTKDITLDYSQSVFSFEFAALNHDLPEDNQYAYKLDGFDKDWVFSGSRRQATYTNLNPGNYTFRVKAANNEGVWNNEGTWIRIKILPPWWKTWWAYGLYIVFAAGIIAKAQYTQYRKRELAEAQSRELEKKVTERTHELNDKNDELRAAYKAMEEQSLSDQLTGLKNRHFLYKTIPVDLASATRYYTQHPEEDKRAAASADLIFYIIDLDYFKSVNDDYGHNNGDIVLKRIAKTLEECCRTSDIIVRWGGEEFLIVSRLSHRSTAHETAERIRQAVANAHIALNNGKVIQRTCSIGFASFPCDIHHPTILSMEQTLHIADHCLYTVKEQGRNGWAGIVDGDIENISPQALSNDIAELINQGALSYINSLTEP
jgi:diguanylate cyclase (GGDEF)-like protein